MIANQMIKLLHKLQANKDGASAAEYALMIALVGGLIIVAATTLSTSISGVFTKMGTTLDSRASAVQNP